MRWAKPVRLFWKISYYLGKMRAVIIEFSTYDSRSEGAPVHEKRQKKSVIFSFIRLFKLSNFQIWNLIKWSLFAILPCKICNFLLDMIVFRTFNSLFQKTTARKNHTFFCRKSGAPSDRASLSNFGIWNLLKEATLSSFLTIFIFTDI